MKKSIFFLLLAFLLMFPAIAYDLEIALLAGADENKNENGFIYRIEDEHAILFGYDGTDTYITLPESIEGFPVTEIRGFSGIRKDAAKGDSYDIPYSDAKVFIEPTSRILSITIPKTVTKICNGAFSHLERLKELVVDSENPNYHAKTGCIIETASATVISGCRAAHIPDTAKIIGQDAFSGTQLESVTIPEGIIEIMPYAFQDADEMHTVKLPSTLTHIHEYAFQGCEKLTRITIPTGVTEIDHGAFSDCPMLTSIHVDESNPIFYVENRCILTRANKCVVAAGYNAKLPEGMTAVERHGFDGCLNEYIEDLILPETLTYIGEYAFAGNGIKKLVIPASVTEIATGAFSGCYSLRTIQVAKNNPRYYSEGGCLIDREYNKVIAACVEKVNIPHGVTTIASNTFKSYSGSTITFPTSVLTIDKNAFRERTRVEVDYMGAPIMWNVLQLTGTGLENAKLDSVGKNADILAAADFDGDGIVRVKDVLRAASATDGEDIDGDSIFTEADIRWIAMLCTAE